MTHDLPRDFLTDSIEILEPRSIVMSPDANMNIFAVHVLVAHSVELDHDILRREWPSFDTGKSFSRDNRQGKSQSVS